MIEEKELRLKSDIEENIEILVDRITELEERLKRLEEKINPYTKKTTPNSPSFTDEKRGDNSVKDMSVSLTKINKEK